MGYWSAVWYDGRRRALRFAPGDASQILSRAREPNEAAVIAARVKSETLSSRAGFCIAWDGKTVLQKQPKFYYLLVLSQNQPGA